LFIVYTDAAQLLHTFPAFFVVKKIDVLGQNLVHKDEILSFLPTNEQLPTVIKDCRSVKFPCIQGMDNPPPMPMFR